MKEETLLIRSLGPCYHPNCSPGGCMVWFQTRKPVAFCSGDSHHHHPRQENRTSVAFLNSQKNCCREDGSDSPHNIDWQKAFTHFGQSSHWRWHKCSGSAGTQPGVAPGNGRLRRHKPSLAASPSQHWPQAMSGTLMSLAAPHFLSITTQT